MPDFGVIVRTRTNPSGRGALVDTGTLHLAGTAASGPTTGVVEVRSLDDWTATFGLRTGVSVPTFDYLDAFFREGGSRALFAPYATDYGDALALLDDARQGPGQLGVVGAGAVPGVTLYSDMRSLCASTNRVALRDVGLADTITGIETDGDHAPTGDDLGATFAPWVEIPPPAGVTGIGARQVPASAVVAALCNRVDQNGNPNRAAAGPDYPLQYATGFSLEVSDADRSLLFDHGVNAFSDAFDVLENYGFQTNIADDPQNPYWQFNCSRGRMYLTARSQAVARNFMFKTLDGRGKLEGELQADLEVECKALYDADGLYGATPQDAYRVQVDSTVNTTTEIAQGELTGVASVVWSMHTRAVIVELVTVPLGNPV